MLGRYLNICATQFLLLITPRMLRIEESRRKRCIFFVATDFMLVGANELWCIIDSFGHTRICLVQIFPLRKVIETFGISWSIQIFRFIIKLDVWSRVADLLIDFFFTFLFLCSAYTIFFIEFMIVVDFSAHNLMRLLESRVTSNFIMQYFPCKFYEVNLCWHWRAF